MIFMALPNCPGCQRRYYTRPRSIATSAQATCVTARLISVKAAGCWGYAATHDINEGVLKAMPWYVRLKHTARR